MLFRGKLKDESSTGFAKYKVILETPELATSCRFTRRFGSTSILRIKIPEFFLNNPNSGLIDFFSRPFILNGLVFRAFYAKDDHVFLVKTNEIFKHLQVHPPEKSSPTCGLPFLELLDWHNPLESNTNQVSNIVNGRAQSLTWVFQSMAKWAARFALGLSTTVPGLRLEASDILDEPDIGLNFSSLIIYYRATESRNSINGWLRYDRRLWLHQPKRSFTALHACQVEIVSNGNSMPSRRKQGQSTNV